MAETPHLGVPEMEPGQDELDVTVNEGFRYLEAGIQGNVKDKDAVTPPVSPADGDRHIVPTGGTDEWYSADGMIAAYKSNSWIFLQPQEGWLVYVQDENLFYLYSGSAWAPLTLAPFSSAPFDFMGFLGGAPAASVFLSRVRLGSAIRFPDNFAGSSGGASVAATASTVFDIQKNGATIGTMTFAIGATTATFATSGSGNEDFAVDDVIGVVAPASPDATLANVGFTLKGVRL